MKKLFARLAVLVAVSLSTFVCAGEVSPAQVSVGSAQVQLGVPAPKPFTYIGEIGIQETVYNPVGSTNNDTTTNINDFIAYVSSKYYQLRTRTFPGSVGIDDQLPTSCILAVVNFRPNISSPIVNQPGVCPVFLYGIQMANHSQLGNCASEPGSWDGTLTALALCNPTQPMFIEPNGTGYISLINIYPHNGVDLTSGTYWGKSWVPTTCTPQIDGGGWNPGDTFNAPQPSPKTYVIPIGVVDTTDVPNGHVLTCHWQANTGYYVLPEKLRERYWTPSFGLTGTVGTIASNNRGNVFDQTPGRTTWYLTTPNTVSNPAATGLEVTMSDQSDYVAGQYNGGNCQQQALSFGNIGIQGASTVNDPTYGPAYGWNGCGRSIVGNSINTGGGWYGIWERMTDFHVAQLVPVTASQANVKVQSASSVDFYGILDTPITHNLEIDGASSVNIGIRAFHNASTSTMTDACVDIGSSGSVSSNIRIWGSIGNCGGSGTGGDNPPIPAILAANVNGLTIDNINVSNCDSTATPPACNVVAHPNNAFIQFGSNVGNCLITGDITGPQGLAPEAILGVNNVPPSCHIRIRNTGSQVEEREGDYDDWPTGNQITSPEGFGPGTGWSTAGSGSAPTIQDNALTAPDGTKTGALLTYPSSSSTGFDRWVGASNSNGAVACFSGYIQRQTSGGNAVGTASIVLKNSTSAVGDNVLVNTLNGTVQASPGGPVGGATTVSRGAELVSGTNGWIHVWISVVAPSSWTFPQGFIANNSGSLGGLGVWGFTMTTNNPVMCKQRYRPLPFGNQLTADTVNHRTLNNANIPGAPVTPVSGTVDQIVGADTTNAGEEIDSYGGTATFRGYRTDGTITSKTTVQSGDVEADLSGRGYDGSGDPPTNANGSFKVEAAENQSSTNHGSKACLATVALGTNGIPVDGFCQQPSGGATEGSPTGGDCGAGCINAQDIRVNNVSVNASAKTITTSYTSHGTNTFTKNSSDVSIDVYICGAGASGGAGGLQLTNNAISGGGGGGGGACQWRTFLNADVPNSLSVVVGQGGASVAGQTTNTTAGSDGNGGAATTFGSLLRAGGGGRGGGGQLAAVSGGGAGGLGVSSGGNATGSTAGNQGTGAGSGSTSANGNSGTTGGSGGAGSSNTGGAFNGGGGNGQWVCPAGGSGGGVTGTNTANNGGNGGANSFIDSTSTAPNTGGTVGTPNGGGSVNPLVLHMPGFAGAGGYGSSTVGGSGGAGTFCSGGGGGGSSQNGGTAGASGAGGDGFAFIVEHQ